MFSHLRETFFIFLVRISNKISSSKEMEIGVIHILIYCKIQIPCLLPQNRIHEAPQFCQYFSRAHSGPSVKFSISFNFFSLFCVMIGFRIVFTLHAQIISEDARNTINLRVVLDIAHTNTQSIS